MSLHPVIRRLLAGIMLFVFAFSITPKKILHDLVANHKDKRSEVAFSATASLSTDGFICKCDNLVAESPFTDAADVFELPASRSFIIHDSAMPGSMYASTHFYFSLRGPPAMA